jgi:hypothetical protein
MPIDAAVRGMARPASGRREIRHALSTKDRAAIADCAAPQTRPKSSGAKRIEMEDGMILADTDGGAMSRGRGLWCMLVPALLALTLFVPIAASAQQVKQIKLTAKQIESFIAADKDMSKLREGADPDKPDPKMEAQAAAVAKKNGFASLDEYDKVSTNISLVFYGIDPQTKQFTEPPERIKKEIEELKADKSVSEAEKKQDLADLAAALKTAKPIQFKDNIALVLKYFDRLAPLMQDPGPG